MSWDNWKKDGNGNSKCIVCGKTDDDIAKGCKRYSVFSPAVGEWNCEYKGEREIRKVSVYYDPVYKEIVNDSNDTDVCERVGKLDERRIIKEE